jgi:putative transposase
MSKPARKNTNREEASEGMQLVLPVREVVRQGLHEFVIGMGLKALTELLEMERSELCGPAYHRGQSGPQRAGTAPGSLVMGGRKITTRRPRVRDDGHEVPLSSWSDFAEEDPLEQRALEQMVLGVSTRGYARSLEAPPPGVESRGTGRSAVSRRFVALTQKRLEEWLQRDISELALAAVMIDGLYIQDHVVLVALGMDESGNKHVLGLWEGATENAEVCISLLSDLIERGLDPHRSLLFVIDGSKALRKAIRDVFGKRAFVQRCQQHKRRNVLGHLPKSLHRSVSKSLRDAWKSPKKSTAKSRLQKLAAALEPDHPGAARSLREGLEETITIKDWTLTPALERTLSTTNPIENLNDQIRRITRRVKRWRDGQMVVRWTSAALLEADKGFRRLRGYKGMPTLVAALRQNDAQIDGGNSGVDGQMEAA